MQSTNVKSANGPNLKQKQDIVDKAYRDLKKAEEELEDALDELENVQEELENVQEELEKLQKKLKKAESNVDFKEGQVENKQRDYNIKELILSDLKKKTLPKNNGTRKNGK